MNGRDFGFCNHEAIIDVISDANVRGIIELRGKVESKLTEQIWYLSPTVKHSAKLLEPG